MTDDHGVVEVAMAFICNEHYERKAVQDEGQTNVSKQTLSITADQYPICTPLPR